MLYQRGQQLFESVLSPFLWIGTMILVFHPIGETPVSFSRENNLAYIRNHQLGSIFIRSVGTEFSQGDLLEVVIRFSSFSHSGSIWESVTVDQFLSDSLAGEGSNSDIFIKCACQTFLGIGAFSWQGDLPMPNKTIPEVSSKQPELHSCLALASFII